MASARALMKELEQAQENARRLSRVLTALAVRERDRVGRVILTKDELDVALNDYEGVMCDPNERGLLVTPIERPVVSETANVVAPPGSAEPRRILQ